MRLDILSCCASLRLAQFFFFTFFHVIAVQNLRCTTTLQLRYRWDACVQSLWIPWIFFLFMWCLSLESTTKRSWIACFMTFCLFLVRAIDKTSWRYIEMAIFEYDIISLLLFNSAKMQNWASSLKRLNDLRRIPRNINTYLKRTGVTRTVVSQSQCAER